MNKTPRDLLKSYLLDQKLQEVVRLYFAGCTLTEAMKLVRAK